MEVILLEKINKLGNLGSIVKVAAGYGRNFLLPQGKALLATEANKAVFEERRAELEAKAIEEHNDAETKKQVIESLESLTIAAKAGDEGKLFGSVGAKEVVEAFKEAGLKIEKKDVRLPEGLNIRNTGEYEVQIVLHTDIIAAIKIAVIEEI